MQDEIVGFVDGAKRSLKRVAYGLQDEIVGFVNGAKRSLKRVAYGLQDEIIGFVDMRSINSNYQKRT